MFLPLLRSEEGIVIFRVLESLRKQKKRRSQMLVEREKSYSGSSTEKKGKEIKSLGRLLLGKVKIL